MKVKGSQFYYKKQRPFLAHGNGNTNMNDLLLLLQYSLSEKEKQRLINYNYSDFNKKMIYYTKTILPYLCVGLAFVILLYFIIKIAIKSINKIVIHCCI
jgi:hypothetical protein